MEEERRKVDMKKDVLEDDERDNLRGRDGDDKMRKWRKKQERLGR